jgi:hypothetical protein
MKRVTFLFVKVGKQGLAFVGLLGRAPHLPTFPVRIERRPEGRLRMFPKTYHNFAFRKVRMEISRQYRVFMSESSVLLEILSIER